MAALELGVRTARIEAIGPWSWARSLEVVEHFGPVRRHADLGTNPLRMTFLLDGSFDPVGVAITGTDEGLDLEVVGTADVGRAARQVARIFSLDHDGSGFASLGGRDPAFGAIQREFPGLRPVCFTSPFECAAWAVISQRISMGQAAAIQDRLATDCGTRLTVTGADVFTFPTPRQLLAVAAFASLPTEKVERLHAVANAALDGQLDVDRLRALGDVDGPASLRAIRGIGPFWAAAIYLRACGIVDLFPDEPIAIAALGALHGLGDRPTPTDIERLADAYRPYRMWACFLLRVAAGGGVIPGIAGREMRIREATSERPRGRKRKG